MLKLSDECFLIAFEQFYKAFHKVLPNKYASSRGLLRILYIDRHILFLCLLIQIFMAIISGAMQMEGAGEQADDVAGAQGSLGSLLGFSDQV